MLLDPGVVIEIAAELAVEPGFVEKDWYAVQVLAAIATHQNNDIATVFCGGTNLSKCYGLLKRFSEDLDFRGQFVSTDPKAQNKSSRRQFRTEIISLLQKLETIPTDGHL
jgi:predicted nucleotidyltransferase component of viral defense system